MHFPRTLFLRPTAVLAALLLAAGLAAQPAPVPAPPPPAADDEDTSPLTLRAAAAQVVLSYHEPINKEKALIVEKGGIVNAVHNVGHQMDAMGDHKEAKARLELTLTPRLTRGTIPRQPAVVTLDTSQDAWELDPDMSPKSTGQLTSDVANVMTQLKAWKRVLTPEQLAQLDRGESLEFTVRTPLAVPVLLSHTNAAVRLTQEPRARVVAIVVTSLRGGRLTVGSPAVVEVTWDHPYKHATCTVKLNAGAQVLALAAKNTGDNLTFRSQPFLPYPSYYDDGLAPPGEDSGGAPGDETGAAPGDSGVAPGNPGGPAPTGSSVIPDRPGRGAQPVDESKVEGPRIPRPEDNAIYRIGPAPVEPAKDPAKKGSMLLEQPVLAQPNAPVPPKKDPR